MRRAFTHLSFAAGLGLFACGESNPSNPAEGGSGGVSAAGGSAGTGASAGGSGAGSEVGGSSGEPALGGRGGSTPSEGGSGAVAGSSAGSAGLGAAGSAMGGGSEAKGFAQMEDLDRGLVALPATGGIFVSWRLMGYEPESIAFDVYRDGTKVNEAPIKDSTNYLDAQGKNTSKYTVRALIDGAASAPSADASVWASGYLSIPTEAPAGSYTSGDATVGDVDGDGQYELIVKWDPSNAKDNSQAGSTSDVYIDAHRLSGERLWRVNLGRNIRAGAHYTQLLVYDLDGDGKAEMLLKTAPGTKDSSGAYLKLGPAANDDDAKDYRNGDGYVLSGPEYVTLFDGLTGKELATETFVIGRGSVGAWGDEYGNRVDRFVGTIAFVDATGRPSAIIGRGMYTRTTFTAWNWRDGKLSAAWTSDNPATGMFGGKGSHGISVANVDDDPMQEIVNGAATFDNDGKGMCAVSWYGHGDALHVGDLLPARPGLEVFMPYEAELVPAYAMRDAKTCEVLWKSPANTPAKGEGPGRGVAADIDPDNEGTETWVSGSQLMRGTNGQNYKASPAAANFLVWWDGDVSRELLNGNAVTEFDKEGEGFTATGCTANNGTKSTPTLSGDLLGDWREEVVLRCGASIRIYTTNQLTKTRIYTLMHDPQYRVAISWQNVEYNQPPHPSFHIGAGMKAPPRPDIHVR